LSEERYFVFRGAREAELLMRDAGAYRAAPGCRCERHTDLRAYGVEEGAFWLARYLFGPTGGTVMIGARVWVINEDGSVTTVAFAESLRQVEQTASAHYPGSAVRIAFPIEPECFFAEGLRTGLDVVEELADPIRLSKYGSHYTPRGTPCLARCNGYEHFRSPSR
jgi:hypothetical protein